MTATQEVTGSRQHVSSVFHENHWNTQHTACMGCTLTARSTHPCTHCV